MAGMPRSIVERAEHILSQMEQKAIGNDNGEQEGGLNVEKPDTAAISSASLQLSIFETVDPTAGKIKAALQDLNINNMTPIECMMKLNELKKVLEGEG